MYLKLKLIKQNEMGDCCILLMLRLQREKKRGEQKDKVKEKSQQTYQS